MRERVTNAQPGVGRSGSRRQRELVGDAAIIDAVSVLAEINLPTGIDQARGKEARWQGPDHLANREWHHDDILCLHRRVLVVEGDWFDLAWCPREQRRRKLRRW